MSMLAEPRRKLKWGLNPRGNSWANDENKFGQKLLEKMGWKKGNGLGKHETGRTEHIRVNYKNDNNGIGWGDNSNGWIAHQDEFNSILASLGTLTKGSNEAHSKKQVVQDSSAPVSLEQRSKSFKSRVHYQKFIREKDVSRYSNEDMKCIFGKKLNAEPKVADGNQEMDRIKVDNTEQSNVNDNNDYSNYSGVSTYKNVASISDYFAEKMKSKLKAKVDLDHKTSDLESSKDVDSKANFVKKKKKKRKRNHSEVLNEEQDNTDTSTPVKRHCDENNKLIKDTCISGGLKKKPKVKNAKLKINLKEVSTLNNSISNSVKEEENSFSDISSLKSCLKKVNSNSVLGTVKEEENSFSKLKSCLKKSNVTNDLKKLVKQVSFSKRLVSYNDTDEEADVEMQEEEAKCEEEKVANAESSFRDKVCDEILSHELDNLLSSKQNNTSSNSYSSPSENTLNDSSCTEHRLPNDNSWAVSQKMAAKMSYYKSVLKNIKKHKIFSTTNLLDIKGYGN